MNHTGGQGIKHEHKIDYITVGSYGFVPYNCIASLFYDLQKKNIYKMKIKLLSVIFI